MPRATKEPIGKVNLNALDDFDTNSLDKLSRDIFPAHTELDAYNQLASKLGLGPLSQQEYDELHCQWRNDFSFHSRSQSPDT